jgi:PadR family transcriptional regulator PadR
MTRHNYSQATIIPNAIDSQLYISLQTILCYTMYIVYLCIMKTEFIENWHSQLRKGLLPLFVFMILENKKCYGYELIQDIKVGFDIDVGEGTLYPLLVRLAKEGLLTHQWEEQPSGIPRKYYSISLEGKSALATMKSYAGLIFKKINE